MSTAGTRRIGPGLALALLALYTGVAADCATTFLTLQRYAGQEYNPVGRALLAWGGWGALLSFQLLWCGLSLVCVLLVVARRPRYAPLLTWVIAVAACGRWIAALFAALTIAHVV